MDLSYLCHVRDRPAANTDTINHLQHMSIPVSVLVIFNVLLTTQGRLKGDVIQDWDTEALLLVKIALGFLTSC